MPAASEGPGVEAARPRHVLAFDCGTTSLKAALINARGVIEAEASAGYALHLSADGFAEQDADEIWRAAVSAGRSVVESSGVSPDDVGSVVFAATWKAILPLDDSGAPLARASIWIDSRGRDQAKRLNEHLGRFVGTGQEYWPRAMWFKERQPALWAAAAHVVGLNTYLKFKATGVLINEPSDDFVFGMDDAASQDLTEILTAADLIEDAAKFAPSSSNETLVGHLTGAASLELGLPESTLVFNGFGDLPAIMIGTGTGQPGRAHIYLGSSSWFVHATSSRPIDVPLDFAVSNELYGAAYVVQSGCLAYDWAVGQLYRAEKDGLGSGVNDLVNREVAEVAPGSDDLLATHWLNGELPPLSKNAKGLFVNLSSTHDRRHMVRAVMESVCFAHRAGYEDYRAKGGVPLDHVRVVGGGALSDVWMQMLSDVLDLRVEVPRNAQSTGALGAFFCAQVGLGVLDSYADVGEAVVIERRFTPRSEAVAVYERLFPIHSQLHGSLRGIFTALNGDY